MADSPLIVEKSLMQARWILADAALEQVEEMARRHNLPEIVARLLCARGVSPEQAEAFLNPTLKRDFPDPLALTDMGGFAEFLARAIMEKKNIAVFGDFDVDGATSAALMHRFLKSLGREARIYIPDRMTEGYGPNAAALEGLKAEGTDIVLLLDCGTAAAGPVAAGRAAGLDIAILDHHESDESLPDANFIINPKRPDDSSGLTMLAACGVTFMACVAVNAKLREMGFYGGQGGTPEPPLKDWLDLVALGTVCDMVPLTGINRLLVRQGFALMHQTRNKGLKALIDTAGLKGEITPYHAGFILGPRINAGSRVHQSDLGARLLCTDDEAEANEIAWILNDCNDKRKALQGEMERRAVEMAEAQGLARDPVIIIEDKDGHPSLAGLVAGRIKEKYGRPACVIAYAQNGQGRLEGRGSGRSVPGVHIARAFMEARAAGLLEKGGGHAMAGGFTVLPEKIEAFKVFMQEHVRGQAGSRQANVETLIDGMLSVRGARADFVRMIHEHIGPFGQEHPEPLFLFSHVRVFSADVVGEHHVRAMVGDWEGGAHIKAMAFRAAGTPLGQALLKRGAMPIHLLGTIKLDTWQGREQVEIHVKDAAFAKEEDKDKEPAIEFPRVAKI